jgi:hypothetical protein
MYMTSVGRRIQPPSPPPSTPGRKSKKAEGKEKGLLTTLMTPVKSSSDLVQVAVNLPKSHLRVLETEAGIYGLRHSQFVELLFLNKIGHQSLVRLKIAPTYQFSRDELSETARAHGR